MGEHFDLPIFCCIIYMWKKIRCLWYLNKIFQRTDWDILLVENKDRLTRFGFNYIKTLLEQQGKKIITINDTDDSKEDLMKDLISVIYSFSTRMYGLRRKKTKKEIIEFIEN